MNLSLLVRNLCQFLACSYIYENYMQLLKHNDVVFVNEFILMKLLYLRFLSYNPDLRLGKVCEVYVNSVQIDYVNEKSYVLFCLKPVGLEVTNVFSVIKCSDHSLLELKFVLSAIPMVETHLGVMPMRCNYVTLSTVDTIKDI